MSAQGTSITITGVREMIAALNNFKAKLPAANKRSIESSMSQAESKAVSTVHVISGELRGSIASKMEGNDKGIMGARAEYAAFEEKRGGPHRYIQPAFEQARKSFPEQYLKEVKGALGSS